METQASKIANGRGGKTNGKGKTPPIAARKTFIEEVDIDLSESEVRELNDELVEALDRVDELEAQKKSTNQEKNADITLAKGVVAQLRQSISGRKSKRPIECYEFHEHRTNTVFKRRVDNDKDVGPGRPMTPDERQGSLDLANGKPANDEKAAKAKAEPVDDGEE